MQKQDKKKIRKKRKDDCEEENQHCNFLKTDITLTRRV